MCAGVIMSETVDFGMVPGVLVFVLIAGVGMVSVVLLLCFSFRLPVFFSLLVFVRSFLFLLR